jgi:hypothetical protein
MDRRIDCSILRYVDRPSGRTLHVPVPGTFYLLRIPCLLGCSLVLLYCTWYPVPGTVHTVGRPSHYSSSSRNYSHTVGATPTYFIIHLERELAFNSSHIHI